ncbi:NAD-binding protein [Litorilinea aerophila]|uniref:Potassium channel protein n=1 Tax=Litorilinea aerophila TaxID=1204385 RepID=A0A540VAG3_9CHLR|nr:potassium channel protein [Litorilinea aerophila]MCC9078431.1 NAD-binding protein [Litorilinea aerophila]GIV76073.1 MAG: potassium channel protein [Litorilinea sp.]
MGLTFRTRLLGVIFTLVVLLAVGTLGYMWLEGWSWREALFMTIITLSTVGYGEVRPLSPEGQVFSMILILLGVGGAAYTFSTVTDYIVAGELRGVLRRRRTLRTIRKMHKHYIICGYGRVGRQVVEGLRANRFSVVVIDADPDVAAELDEKDIPHIIGDAADEEVLIQAGIDRASGLCTCLPSDATNVFTILSARTLNPDVYIVSRSNFYESEKKLRMAGADHVINPYWITGHRMAAQLLHPGVVEFLDVIMRQGELELRIEEIRISQDSPLAGKTLGQCQVRTETGVNVLAIRCHDGQIVTSPGPEYPLQVGDALIGLGTVAQLTKLARLAGDNRPWLHMADAH